MYNRGGGGGGFRGGRGGSRGGNARGSPRGGAGGFRGGRGGAGGRGGGNYNQYNGPPSEILPLAEVTHPVGDNQIVGEVTLLDKSRVPYFTGRVFLENKEEIGKIDEIFGPLNQMFVSITLGEGIKPATIAKGTKLFIDPNQTLPLERFMPKARLPDRMVRGMGKKPASGEDGQQRGGFGQRGGRGGFGQRGGRGGFGQRGGGRGGRGGGGYRR